MPSWIRIRIHNTACLLSSPTEIKSPQYGVNKYFHGSNLKPSERRTGLDIKGSFDQENHMDVFYQGQKTRGRLKGTQDWEFFWLRFWNLRYFFVSYVKILRFKKKFFLIGPLLGEVGFFRGVLGLRGMKKNLELGQKIFFLLFQLWTLYMT